MTQYLRSENKVHYEHVLIDKNRFVDQILGQICDLGAPFFYVYMVYEKPQMIMKLEIRKFLPIGQLCFIPANSAHAFERL